MEIVDPGHAYRPGQLDESCPGSYRLTVFVKREGPKYPGNKGAHSGTTLQELWRIEIDRLKYLEVQMPCPENYFCLENLRQCIKLLETRAARNHGRSTPEFWVDVENMPTCYKCLHIGCEGRCK